MVVKRTRLETPKGAGDTGTHRRANKVLQTEAGTRIRRRRSQDGLLWKLRVVAVGTEWAETTRILETSPPEA